MNYGYRKRLELDFTAAVTRVKEELAEAGFGVLTEIDVQETLKKKIGVDYDSYVILGACNPPLAYAALQAEKSVGLLLPCNVIIYEDQDELFVESILPTQAMKVADNPELREVAEEVEQKLKNVINSI